MQFLWKYIEDLVGKGLEWYVIAELFLYASASLVTMALPLAILLSSIMTFGNLGEHYELVAMKSSGLSLQRIMRPLIVFVIVLSGVAFYFSNSIWPIANLKFKSLLWDVTHAKPALDISPDVFYKGIDNYVIRIKEKDKDGKGLQDILIYDHSEGNGNRKVIKAESGRMFITKDQRYLVLSLKNGYQYDEIKGRSNPLFRSEFEEHIIKLELVGFDMKRSDESLWKDHYQMMNIGQLQSAIDSLSFKLEKRKSDYSYGVTRRLALYADSTKTVEQYSADSAVGTTAGLVKSKQLQLYATAINLARASKTYSTAMKEEVENRRDRIRRFEIEWHRKFTLSIACFVLFFVGAPLGAIIRKGGLGMPVVVAVIFFLIFHISSITGEKLVKQDQLDVEVGMWMSTFILAPIGAFLTYKATTDSVLLDATFYTKLTAPITRMFRSIISKFKKNQE